MLNGGGTAEASTPPTSAAPYSMPTAPAAAANSGPLFLLPSMDADGLNPLLGRRHGGEIAGTLPTKLRRRRRRPLLGDIPEYRDQRSVGSASLYRVVRNAPAHIARTASLTVTHRRPAITDPVQRPGLRIAPAGSPTLTLACCVARERRRQLLLSGAARPAGVDAKSDNSRHLEQRIQRRAVRWQARVRQARGRFQMARTSASSGRPTACAHAKLHRRNTSDQRRGAFRCT